VLFTSQRNRPPIKLRLLRPVQHHDDSIPTLANWSLPCCWLRSTFMLSQSCGVSLNDCLLYTKLINAILLSDKKRHWNLFFQHLLERVSRRYNVLVSSIQLASWISTLPDGFYLQLPQKLVPLLYERWLLHARRLASERQVSLHKLLCEQFPFIKFFTKNYWRSSVYRDNSLNNNSLFCSGTEIWAVCVSMCFQCWRSWLAFVCNQPLFI